MLVKITYAKDILSLIVDEEEEDEDEDEDEDDDDVLLKVAYGPTYFIQYPMRDTVGAYLSDDDGGPYGPSAHGMVQPGSCRSARHRAL